MTQFSPIRYLTELASAIEGHEDCDEPDCHLIGVRANADHLVAGCPFPLTATTLYAMNYGVLYNYSIVEATNPFIQAAKRWMPDVTLDAEDHFLLVLAEVARRILAGEIETPEVSL